jgi:dCMP deaminase
MNDAKQTTWDERFFFLAKHVAQWSRDPSTQVGAVIVGPSNEIRAIGYNGFPRNVEGRPDLLERPAKYAWIEHAERNAIFTAARVGISLLGSRMYVSWFPCTDCARAIVQVGIVEVICIEPDWKNERWSLQFQQAREILAYGAVTVRFMQLATSATG